MNRKIDKRSVPRYVPNDSNNSRIQWQEMISMFAIRISKHSPENCPAFEAKFKGTFLKAVEMDESLAAKHGIKIVGAWVDSPGHTVYSVYDAPSMENLMEYSMEPEMMATMSFQTSVMKPLKTIKEVAAMIKRN
jgi:hypothetical protein